MHFSKLMEYIAPRLNPGINLQVWVMTVRQCSFIKRNKYATLVLAVDSGKSCGALGKAGHIGPLCIYSSLLL